ncbi:metalloprotease [Coemansia sp. RSA 1933]|nr:metalloprotease [Coemansia sp. RSA 1933]
MYTEKSTMQSQTSYDEYIGEIDVSMKSQQQQRLVRLRNGMKVLCVSDADAQQSTVCVCVNVGSSADPVESQGLAHLVEHVLFMGTAKYPDTNDFDQHIARYAGDSNATTSGYMTWYHATLDHDGLAGAVDRLAQFFAAPLLENHTGDEMAAVQAEFEELAGSDVARFQRLESTLSTDGHSYAQLASGNRTTLHNEPQVRRFFDTMYSAPAMQAVVVGAAPLDQMTELAVEAFSAIPNRGNPTMASISGMTNTEHPLAGGQLGTVVQYQTLGDMYAMDMSFAVPDLRSQYASNIEDCMEGVLRLDGAGSLASQLRSRGWITGSVTACFSTRARMAPFGGIFHIGFSCTPEGFRHYADIAALAFGYIEAVCRDSQLLEPLYRELQTASRVAQIRALSANQTSWAVRVAQGMGNPHLEPAHVITGALQTCYSFDGAEIERFAALLRPSNCRIMLGARSHDAAELDLEEPHFGIRYRIDQAPNIVPAVDGVFHLQPPNEYLPMEKGTPAIVGSTIPTSGPKLVSSTEQSELWVAPIQLDDPVALSNTIHMYVESAEPGHSPRAWVCMQLFTALVQEQMTEQLQAARRVGLDHSVSTAAHGLTVRVSGLVHAMPLVVAVLLRILGIVRNQSWGSAAFARKTGVHRRFYSNQMHKPPGVLAGWFAAYLTNRNAWHYNDCRTELDSLEYAEFAGFCKRILNETRVVMLVSGAQATVQTARDILDAGTAALGPTSTIPEFRRPNEAAHALHPGTYHCHTEHSGAHNAVSYTVWVGAAGGSRRGRAMAMLVARLAQQPFFDQIRTREQLAYTATCTWIGPGRSHSAHMLRFTVQGAANPWYLRQRIDAFLRDFRHNVLASLETAECVRLARGMAESPACTVRGGERQAARHWAHIEAGHYDFCQDAAVRTHLLAMRPADLISFWDTFVDATSPSACKAIAHMWGCTTQRQSMADARLYPVSMLALHSCTKCVVAIAQVAALVRSCHRGCQTDDGVFARLCELAHISPTEAETESCQQLRCALQMAVDDDGSQPTEATVRLENAGAWRTAANEWVVEDYVLFRSKQPIHGRSIPFHRTIGLN